MSTKELVTHAKASAPVPITTLLESWDTSDIFESQKKYLMEKDEDTKAKIASGELTVEGLEKSIWEDQDLWSMCFDDMCANIETYLNKINPNGYFKAEVKNFGWRNQNGHKVFHAANGREFLNGILPNTECTYHIFKVKHGKKLAIQNFHHDSPVGNEWYVVSPCSQFTYNIFSGR